MSAVMVEHDQEDVPELGWRELDALLKYWGSARWRVGLSGGFPEQSAIVERVELYEPRDWFRVSQLTARGRQNPYYGGHRILGGCWGVSKQLLMVNAAVNLLPQPQFEAVVVTYAIGYAYAKDFSRKQQAEILEITPEALHERLKRARKSLGRMLIGIRAPDARLAYLD